MARATIIQKEIAANFPELKFSAIKLSRGSNADVFVMESDDGNKFVLKAIDKAKKKEKDLTGTEEAALRKVKSDYVIQLLAMKETKNHKFYLFPFIDGRGLDEILAERKQFFSNEEILSFAKQMAQAIIDMHKAGVIHQDIKPRNIRTTPDNGFVILDLGIARFKEDGKRVISRGAYGYSSPEQIWGALHHPHMPPTTFSADHWAIATIMYQMATLKHPFSMDADMAVNEPITDPQKINGDLGDNISKIIKTILNNKHASGRYPTPESLLEILNGREYKPQGIFKQPVVLFSLKRTRVGGREFVNEYKADVIDEILIPHGVLLPAGSITKKNEFLNPLRGQGYHLFVDPETYIRNITEGASFTQKFFSKVDQDKLISDTVNLQLKCGADYLISPDFCVEDANSNELKLTTVLFKETKKYLENEGRDVPLFGGLFIGRNILANGESRKRVLDELLPATDGLDGIYLVVDTATGSMPINDRDLLIGLRTFVEILSKKLPVVLGYGDIVALGLIPSGLSGIVSHPYPSARKININSIRNNYIAKRKKEKAGKKEKEIPWPKPEDQFYAPQLLNFIKVTGELDKWITSDQYNRLGEIIVCDCPFCNKAGIFQKAKTDRDISKTPWKKEYRSNHFIYNLAKDVNIMSQKTSADARKYFLNKIKTAKTFYDEIKKSDAQLHAHSKGDFLNSWEESFG